MSETNLTTVPKDAVPLRSDRLREQRVEGGSEFLGEYSYRPAPAFGFTLAELVDVLKNRYLMILAGALIGAFCGFALVGLTPPLFAVSARVVISLQDPGKLVDTDSGSSTFIHTQAEVISSPAVIQGAVQMLPPPRHLPPGDDPVISAMEAVHASAVTGTRVIALAYLGVDPDYGARLLSAMVKSYGDTTRDSTGASQLKSIEAKSAELESLQVDIEARERQLASQREQAGVVGSVEDASMAQQATISANARELATVRNRRMELESRLSTGGWGMAADDPVHRAMRDDLRRAEAELSRLKMTLMPEHPAVVAAQRNVAVLRSQMTSSSDGSPQLLAQQIRELSRLERELGDVENQARAALETIERHRLGEAELLAELDRLRLLADRWRREISDQRLTYRLTQSGDAGISAKVIAEPIVPQVPVWPKPKMIIPLFVAVGIALAFVIALASRRNQVGSRLSQQ